MFGLRSVETPGSVCTFLLGTKKSSTTGGETRVVSDSMPAASAGPAGPTVRHRRPHNGPVCLLTQCRGSYRAQTPPPLSTKQKTKKKKKKTQILDTRPGCLAVEPLELDELFPAHLNNGVAHSEECRGALGAQLALRMNSPLPAKSFSPRRALGLFCSVALATARLMAQPGPLCRSLSVGGLARSCRREPRGVQLLLFLFFWQIVKPDQTRQRGG